MRPSLGCTLKERPPNYQGCSPRVVLTLLLRVNFLTLLSRAYVVPKIKPQPGAESTAFSKDIQEWVRSRVAKHKFLRGGVVVIDQVPKSAAGKILRRQLRDLVKAEPSLKPKL